MNCLNLGSQCIFLLYLDSLHQLSEQNIHHSKILQLKDREWTCPHCGNTLDRDVNAAMNILQEGLRNTSAGTVDYTDGADVRPYQGQSAMKSEAHKSLVCG